MPSVTDVQQPTATTTTTDSNSTDPITQSILVLEKKQRNLGKRKEKLESYQEEAKKGKELNKDQKDALAKYPEVLGQIECVKDLNEQFKKIQTDAARNQKRLSKQANDEKRAYASQRVREYALIRYLFENRPTSIKPEESVLLDQLSTVIIPSDNTLNSISRSVDTVMTIYQGGSLSTTIKNLTGKTSQEIREVFEELIKNFDTQQVNSSSTSTRTATPPPPPPPAPLSHPEQEEQTKELEETNDIQTSNDDPIKFDTRNQNYTAEQIIQNSPFISSNDLNNQIEDDNNHDQSPNPQEYLQTFTVVNSNINDQSSSLIQDQQQENLTDEQQLDEQWQHQRGNGNTYRGGQQQFNNGYGNRNYNRGGPNNYNQQPRRGGPRGGGGNNWYDNSYGNNQRQYNENNRGRGGSNPNYRGNRGGNYRGGNRGYNHTGNEYQKSAQYQQVHSAPPSSQQQ